MSRLDQMTGTYNRRIFIHLPQKLAQAALLLRRWRHRDSSTDRPRNPWRYCRTWIAGRLVGSSCSSGSCSILASASGILARSHADFVLDRGIDVITTYGIGVVCDGGRCFCR